MARDPKRAGRVPRTLWRVVLGLPLAVLSPPGCKPDADEEAQTDADLYPCATGPDTAEPDDEPGALVSISLGAYAACGTDVDGATSCWGCANDDQPAGSFRVVDLEYNHACGITLDGEGVCWAWGPFAGPAEALEVPSGEWVDVSVGLGHTCWLGADGSLACVGEDGDGQCDVPEAGPWRQVSAGEAHTCAIDLNGCESCWGTDSNGETELPDGWDACLVASLDAGGNRTCFLANNGALECRGGRNEEDENVDPPWAPDGKFQDMSVGVFEPCALDADGVVDCPWGGGYFFGCPAEEDEAATAVDTAWYATCVVLADGSSSCWGAGYPREGDGDPICRRGSISAVFGR